MKNEELDNVKQSNAGGHGRNQPEGKAKASANRLQALKAADADLANVKALRQGKAPDPQWLKELRAEIHAAIWGR